MDVFVLIERRKRNTIHIYYSREQLLILQNDSKI